jgi:glycerol-3-phosphate dehydrogenase
MKKPILLAFMLFTTVTLITSCSSRESDAKKLGELMCKGQKLATQAKPGDMSAAAEAAKLAKEAYELENEIKSKYSSEEDKKVIEDIVMKELKNCK